MSDKAIPVAMPLLGEVEAQAARRAILSGWVTQGPEVAAFETEFAVYVGAPYAKAVSNCTSALHMALLAVGVGSGDEVVTVSHSFVATANAVRYCGATPVFVDILPGVWNVDPAQIIKAVSPRTKVILCVHQLGMPCDLKTILAIARPLGLPVIEDAACAIGSEIDLGNGWERIGKPHGDIACFSFHPRKVITTGDGGMLTTANPDYHRRFTLLRQHGMSASDLERHNSSTLVIESYPELGFNYRLTDIQAAVGREQLKRLPNIIARRRELAARYLEKLGAIEGLEMPVEPSWARSNWQSFCVGLPRGVGSRAVLEALLSVGISAKRGVMCAHREQIKGRSWSCAKDNCQCPPFTCELLRKSEAAQDYCIIIPLYPQMEDSDQDRVVRALADILDGV